MKPSYKRLSLEQRQKIKELKDRNCSIRSIAGSIGVSPATVHRELRVNIIEEGEYDPILAERRYQKNMYSKRRVPVILSNPELAGYISDLILNENLSPKQVSIRIRKEAAFIEKPCVNTIYRAIDQGLIPGVTRETLNVQETKMFSNGMVCIPKWAREKFDFHDGDIFSLKVKNDGTIILKKQDV